jgi:hypothetical protein
MDGDTSNVILIGGLSCPSGTYVGAVLGENACGYLIGEHG